MSEEEKEKIEIEEGVIENVGVLNFKDVSPEDLEKIRLLRNIGLIIVPGELMGKVASIPKENVGAIIPYIEGAKTYVGEVRISADTLRRFEEPVDIIIVGEAVFEEDVTAELIDEKIKTVRVYGEVVAPADSHQHHPDGLGWHVLCRCQIPLYRLVLQGLVGRDLARAADPHV